MKEYVHRIQYHETDMMGIAHHSNYIKWMEEARTDFMDQMGFGYDEMEERGIISPVRKISADYRISCTYKELISIDIGVEKLTPARLVLSYTMKNEEGTEVFTAASEHCFLNRKGRLVRLDRVLPDFYEDLKKML